VTLLDGGQVIAHGTPDEFIDAERLKGAYFGA
jgi:hypothetical protein